MFTDIHCHILFGTDDGPETKEEMSVLLDQAYADGIRVLCATPHFNFSFYGNNIESADVAFELLWEQASARYPDMTVCRGNEIFYHDRCVEYLCSGMCKSLNATKHILVDFSHNEPKYNIINAIKKLISYGFIPVLAHAERYSSLGFTYKSIEEIKEYGALIQINAASVAGKNGARKKFFACSAIRHGLCDVIASDTHNTSTRKSYMTEAYEYVCAKFGRHVADALTKTNPNMILNTRVSK